MLNGNKCYVCVNTVFSDCKSLTSDSSTCWRFVDEQKTWGEAQQSCISHGGHLAVEYSAELRQAIIAELANQPSINRWWFGLRNVNFEYWRWNFERPLGKSYVVIL